MLIHTLKVDDAQHRHGLFSEQAKDRIERADRQLGRLMAAIERLGLWPRTTLVVLSDHGFAPLHTRFRPNHRLKELGLLPEDESRKLSWWKALTVAAGGLAYVYVAKEDDQATKDLLLQTFAELARQPDSPIRRIFSQDDIRARGGDPQAFLALEASPGVRLSTTLDGQTVTRLGNKGTHGYPPDRPEMNGALLIYGRGIVKGRIDGARVIDIAPTVAAWLGFAMPGVEGRALALPESAAPGVTGSPGRPDRP